RKLSKWRFDPALHVIMRDCLAAPTSTGGHANPADGIAADRTRNGAAIFHRPSVNQGDVRLLHPASGKFSRQLAMSSVVLLDHNEPAGFLVEAMNDAGAELAADRR